MLISKRNEGRVRSCIINSWSATLHNAGVDAIVQQENEMASVAVNGER